MYHHNGGMGQLFVAGKGFDGNYSYAGCRRMQTMLQISINLNKSAAGMVSEKELRDGDWTAGEML